MAGHLGEPVLKLKDICIIVELELPEGDEGKEENWEEGEQGVGHALAPHRAELMMSMVMTATLMRMMRMVTAMRMRRMMWNRKTEDNWETSEYGFDCK